MKQDIPLSPPSEDKRWKLVNATMRQHGYKADALIETLHTVQESFGYIDEVALKYVSQSLYVPLSKAFGVATFYHFFSLKPQGNHSCVVCMGTACYIKGGQNIIDAIHDEYSVEPGETTSDNQLSLLTARCLGSCGLAPAAVIDGEIAAKLTPNHALEQLRRTINGL